MLRSRRLKIINRKLGVNLILLPSILLIVGCLYMFISDNILSFVFSLIIPLLFVLNLIFGVYWLFKKNRFFLFSLIGMVIYFFCYDSFFQFKVSTSSSLNEASLKLDTLSILSYNTHGFKHDAQKVNIDNQILDFINSRNTDVFCIQEFSAIKYKYFDKYPHWFKTNIIEPNKTVMAIFSKYPIIDRGYINFPNSSNGSMYVDLNFNKEIIRIYNLHLESFKVGVDIYDLSETKSSISIISRISIAEKLRKEQVIIIKNHIESFKGRIIICGDFNSTQFTSSYNILKDSRKDTFIEAGSRFGSTYKLFNYPLRLDYILVDDSINVLSHQNFDLKISDHEPILSRLLIN